MKIRLRGIETFYLEQGNPEGLPVVLIHAYPMSHRMWERQLEALGPDLRVITYDVRGLGATEPGKNPFTFETLVEDLLALLDHLKVGRAVLCGLSMGGYIALRTVQRNPDRVFALILCDTQSTTDTNEGRLHRHEAIQTIEEKGVSTFAEGFAKKVLADETLMEKTEIAGWVKKIVNSNSTLGICRITVALATRLDTTEALAQIKVPTLVVTGEFDKLIPVSKTRDMEEQIPGAQLVVIPKAGHMSNMENPEEFNRQVIGFLNHLSKR